MQEAVAYFLRSFRNVEAGNSSQTRVTCHLMPISLVSDLGFSKSGSILTENASWIHEYTNPGHMHIAWRKLQFYNTKRDKLWIFLTFMSVVEIYKQTYYLNLNDWYQLLQAHLILSSGNFKLHWSSTRSRQDLTTEQLPIVSEEAVKATLHDKWFKWMSWYLLFVMKTYNLSVNPSDRWWMFNTIQRFWVEHHNVKETKTDFALLKNIYLFTNKGEVIGTHKWGLFSFQSIRYNIIISNLLKACQLTTCSKYTLKLYLKIMYF